MRSSYQQNKDLQDNKESQKPFVFLMAQGETSRMVNGKIVDNKTLNTVYDGNNMMIKGTDNGNVVFSKKMNNDDIIKLLENPANRLSLIERISKDFKVNTNTSTPNNTRNKRRSKTKTKTKTKNKNSKSKKNIRNTRKRNTRKRNTRN